MFCRLTYSCIQFIQRMVPPLSINYKTKPNGLSLLYKNSGQMSTKSFIKKKILKIEYQTVFSEFTVSTSL